MKAKICFFTTELGKEFKFLKAICLFQFRVNNSKTNFISHVNVKSRQVDLELSPTNQKIFPIFSEGARSTQLLTSSRVGRPALEILEQKEYMNAYQAPVDIPSSKHSSKCDQHTNLCHILLYPEQFPSNSSYENKLATIYRENVSSLYCCFRRSTCRRSYTGKTQHSLVRSKTSRKN